MDENACVEFLQWALPELHMRWTGFRKVHNQVCKRINRRLQTLQLRDITAYQEYLQCQREEWAVLDGLCRITISRFFRDRLVFSTLQRIILPELVQQMQRRGETVLRLWSVGCAAGEEPYSLNILWELDEKQRVAHAQAKIEIIATDSDQQMLDRAAEACYSYGSIKNIPEDWRQRAFNEDDGEFCLRPPFRQGTHFMCQDIRLETPEDVFDLILCRNLVFTYFEDRLQRQVLSRLEQALRPKGWLVIGIHETLPQDYDGFEAWSRRLGIYQRRS
ncbi:MAG: chemotaxis protein CheR [Gammaproteobacteria bacterium]|nr:chemotaxis protein CheR [Gammaproteobacteria bacterium]